MLTRASIGRRCCLWLAVAFFAAGGAGCATARFGELRTGEPCLGGYVDEAALARELATAPVVPIERLSFAPPAPQQDLSIDRTSPVVLIDRHRVRVFALDLARPGYPADRFTLLPATVGMTAPADVTCMTLRSATSDGSAGARGLVPNVLWLDDQRLPLGEPTRGVIRALDRAGQEVGWSYERPAGGRYAIIFPDPRSLGQREVLERPRYMGSMFVPGVGVLPMPQGGPEKFVGVATGKFVPLLIRGVRVTLGVEAIPRAPMEIMTLEEFFANR